MLSSPNRLTSNPHMSLVWVVLLSATTLSIVVYSGLRDLVMTTSRQSSTPHMSLVWVAVLSTMALSILVFSCLGGLVPATIRQSSSTSPHAVWVGSKLFYLHAFFTLGRGYHN